MYIKIVKLQTVDSTNNYAARLAEQGAKEITVVMSKEQSKGKGRMGKYWTSPLGKGVYASFVFRPAVSLKDIYYFPLMFSLAVARLLSQSFKEKEDVGKHPQIKIKLPNDVMLCGKKVSGILVEVKTTGKKIDFVIVGMGVNVNSTKAELPPKATSLYLETEKKYNLEDISKSLIREVMIVYDEFKKGKIKRILEEALAYQRLKSINAMEEIFLKETKEREAVHLI
ncbi:MAG: biotin--[acetyl-CoA-carboxylase] ligase [Candidatus Omnitrophota bacterium]